MFGITGGALTKVKNMQNGGKRPRHSIDAWDRQSACFPLPFGPTRCGIFLRGREVQASDTSS